MISATRSPLHVAVGVLAGVTGGPASYGRRLVHALAALRDEVRITVVTDAPEAFANGDCEVVHVPMRGGLDRLPWQHLKLPRALRKIAPDVYHDTKNALPYGLRVPAVVTVHDLAYHTVPESFGLASRLFLRSATRHAARRARVVVVPSQATATDMMRIHPEATDKVRVIPHGIDPAEAIDPVEMLAVRERLHLPRRYVLHVGTIQSRKNVHLVIQAVRALRVKDPELRVVLVGRRGWLADEAFREIERDDTTQWLGTLPGSDLAVVYAAAQCFVSPSGYEGFGMTVGDALAAGVPTVVSGISSLPEVCGDAALVLESLDAGSVTRAIERVFTDHALAAQLRERGRRRAQEFSWGRSAREHLAAYHAAIATEART